MNKDLLAKAYANLAKLKSNTYPGRLLIVGVDEGLEHYVLLYGLTARSAPSRNRILKRDGDDVRTDAIDWSIVKDDDRGRIIYTTMRDHERAHIVSNGDHTDTIYDELEEGRSFCDAMQKRTYENDGYTARIAAVLSSFPPLLQIAILYKDPEIAGEPDDDCALNIFCRDSIPEGMGYCIHTYASDGQPPPVFSGEPYLVPLQGSPEQIVDTYWNAFDRDNRIAIAGKFIAIKTGEIEIIIRNKEPI